MRIHVRAKLRDLPRIEPDLVDDEVRPALDLLLQLQVLRNYLALAQLEIRCYGTNAELSSSQALAIAAKLALSQSLIHSLQQRNQPNRINIENRLGEPLVTSHRKIASHRQDIVESLAIEHPCFALQTITIEIFAGEVDYNFLARIEDRPAQSQRRELRIASGVIG